MRTRKSDSLDTRNCIQQLKETRKVACGIVWGLIVIHDLSKEMNLFVALIHGSLHLVENFLCRTHPLVTSSVRDHTESTKIIAAFDNRYIGLDWISTPRHPKGK
jgi:hypothetical protein